MPFKSLAQARKFFELNNEGKITDAQLEEWIRSTPDFKHLPERVKHKKKTKKHKKHG